MPYKKMKLEYFKLIEPLLKTDVYIRISLDLSCEPVIELVKINEDGEDVIMKSDNFRSNSKNILDLFHEMSTRLNDDEPLFPQYANNKMRRKALDNVLALDYEIYFYRLIDNRILGTISKVGKRDIYDIFIATCDTLKGTFEALDSEIFNKFGFYPDLGIKNKEILGEYTEKIIRQRIKMERNFKSNF